ncbi:hypothetical protein VTG60DRAFT_536 [Thermothelomyces hinnuleus]
MTLLLAHLDAHHHRAATNFLAHQRLSDHAMLEQALERMDAINTVNRDVTTAKSAELIRRLLEIENDAAGGSNYTTRSDQEGGGDDRPRREGEELHLTIPYFGVVRIARQGPIFRRPLTGNPCCSQEAEPPLGGPATAAYDDTLHGAVTPTLSSLPSEQVSSHSSDAKLESTWGATPGMHFSSPKSDSMLLLDYEGLPPITADVDDWAFQGVDMAFFNGLMRGNADSDTVRPER